MQGEPGVASGGRGAARCEGMLGILREAIAQLVGGLEHFFHNIFGYGSIIGHPNTERWCILNTGWWSQTYFIHNIWDNPSHWLILFKMVKTTNQWIYIFHHDLAGGLEHFPIHWNNYPNWLSYFSRWLEPPTSLLLGLPHCFRFGFLKVPSTKWALWRARMGNEESNFRGPIYNDIKQKWPVLSRPKFHRHRPGLE
jgi:hypothetical protein